MKGAAIALLAGLIVLPASSGGQAAPAVAAAPLRAPPPAEDPAVILARMADPDADPVQDADRAIAAGRFGLIVAGRFFLLPPGVVCLTPEGGSSDTIATFRHGDAVDDVHMRMYDYATAYNLRLVARPDYPDADLCRLRTPDDQNWLPSANGLKQAARTPDYAPRTLYEAARRGQARDVRRFLGAVPIDAEDTMGMTALAWAVARGNRATTDLLLARGADPAAGREGRSALYWSIAQGRRAMFYRLMGRVSPEGLTRAKGGGQGWSSINLRAAITGGDIGILERLLADPHRPISIAGLPSPLPDAAMITVLMRDGGAEAPNALLVKTLETYGPVRLDLVAMALDNGADPDAVAAYDTALGLVANGIGEGKVEAVEQLVAAGADVNRMSHRTRPVWMAVSSWKAAYSPDSGAQGRRIFDILVAHGADLTLPNFDGRPPVWALMFPVAFDHERLEPFQVTPDLLKALVASGMDINAPWEGRRILAVVEAKAGVDSAEAAMLRAAGAS